MIKELFDDNYDRIENIEILNGYENSHGIEFTDDELDEYINTFESEKDIYKPNVKLDHTQQQIILKELFKEYDIPHGTEIPALGYIERMYKKGKSLFADIGHIPRVLKDKVFNGQYKSISPELYRNFRGTGKRFLKSIVLTNNPSMRHVMDVHMADAVRFDGIINILDEEDNMDNVTKETLDSSLDKFAEKIKGFFKRDEVQMSEKTEVDELRAQVAELSQVVKNQAEEKISFSEKVKAIESQAHSERVKAITEKAASQGVPTVIIDKLSPILMSDYGRNEIVLMSETEGEKVEVKMSVTDIIKDVFDNYPDKVDFAEKTVTSMSVPSKDSDDVKMSKVNKRKQELIGEGMSAFDALVKAQQEIL